MAPPHTHRSLGGAGRQLVASVRGWQVWTLRPAARAYVIAVVAVDWAVTVVALITAAARGGSLLKLGICLGLLACAAIVVEATRSINEVKGTNTRDLQGAWFLPIAIIGPPGLAFLAPILLGVHRLVRVRRVFPHRRVFTAATVSLAYGAASIVFHAAPAAIAGPMPRAGTHAVAWLGLAAGCGVLAWLVNNALILAAIRLATPEVPLRDASGGRAEWITDLIELSLAVTVALAVVTDPAVMVLALPLVVFGQRYVMGAQLVSQIRADAQSGVLTGVIWRYEADAEAAEARRMHRSLAVAIVGVDDFSSITGTAGPGAGQVMRAIATTLTEHLPPAAQVGLLRRGQFAIVVPGVSEDQARRLAVRIRDHVAGEPVAIESDSRLDFVFRPTVSVGVAGLASSRHTVTELIAAADAALAAARAGGGNRVDVAPQPGAVSASAG